MPPQLTEFICEIEMAVIIGQEARNISEGDVPSIIAGYAIVNDITASSHFDTGRFKMFDQMTPIGAMVSHVDPHNVDLEMWVNGSLIQKDNTANLLFSSNWLIAHISRMATLCRGDIVLTGTPSNPYASQLGDVIEMRSPQLGNHRFMIHQEL